MSDILQEAEALIEKHTTSGYIHRDATLLLPGLVEEIKRLRVLECAADANMTRRNEDVSSLMKELAAKDALNDGLMANCNQHRNRCWKAEGKKPRTLHEAVSDLRYILGSFDPFTLFALGWLVGSIMTWIAAWIVVGEI
jgi:hypothetical protein